MGCAGYWWVTCSYLLGPPPSLLCVPPGGGMAWGKPSRRGIRGFVARHRVGAGYPPVGGAFNGGEMCVSRLQWSHQAAGTNQRGEQWTVWTCERCRGQGISREVEEEGGLGEESVGSSMNATRHHQAAWL